MRLGDSIVIGRAEAEVLQSEAFAKAVTPEVARKIRLTRINDHYELALPKVGRPVVEALQAIHAEDQRQAVVAEVLAEAIEQRIRRS
jgi:hypothetical protein